MPLDQEGSIRRRRHLDSSTEDIDDRGWTLLHIYAKKGDVKGVKRLLDKGVDANVAARGPKSHGVTPLHLAAKGGHLTVMDELLEKVLILMHGPRVPVVGPHFTTLLKKGRKVQ